MNCIRSRLPIGVRGQVIIHDGSKSVTSSRSARYDTLCKVVIAINGFRMRSGMKLCPVHSGEDEVVSDL